jgi:hypothetical protein
VVAGHQQITTEWWARGLPRFDAYVSAVVEDEVVRGDPQVAQRRLSSLAGLPRLPVTDAVTSLARFYYSRFKLPQRAAADSIHLALAVVHRMDYLVSWNMTHIASGRVVLRLHELNAEKHLHTPVICTPEELLE